MIFFHKYTDIYKTINISKYICIQIIITLLLSIVDGFIIYKYIGRVPFNITILKTKTDILDSLIINFIPLMIIIISLSSLSDKYFFGNKIWFNCLMRSTSITLLYICTLYTENRYMYMLLSMPYISAWKSFASIKNSLIKELLTNKEKIASYHIGLMALQTISTIIGTSIAKLYNPNYFVSTITMLGLISIVYTLSLIFFEPLLILKKNIKNKGVVIVQDIRNILFIIRNYLIVAIVLRFLLGLLTVDILLIYIDNNSESSWNRYIVKILGVMIVIGMTLSWLISKRIIKSKYNVPNMLIFISLISNILFFFYHNIYLYMIYILTISFGSNLIKLLLDMYVHKIDNKESRSRTFIRNEILIQLIFVLGCFSALLIPTHSRTLNLFVTLIFIVTIAYMYKKQQKSS